MTEAQAYVEWLSELLAEFRGDPAKCEAIKACDERDGAGLLPLLFDWYAEAHPDRVTTTTTRTSGVISRTCQHRCRLGEADGPPPTPG